MDIEYQFKFSKEHAIETMLRYRMQIWWRRPFITFKWILTMLIFALLVLSVINSLYLPSIIFGGILGALLLGWPIDRWLLIYRFRKSPYYDDDIAYTLNENGTFIAQSKGKTDLSWDAYTKARRFSDGLLLFQGPHLFTWLPDNAISELSSIAAACMLVKSHVSDYREV